MGARVFAAKATSGRTPRAKPFAERLDVDEVLAGEGLPVEVARSMLAAVMLGKTHEVSKYLWMRLLTTYIDTFEEPEVDLSSTFTDEMGKTL